MARVLAVLSFLLVCWSGGEARAQAFNAQQQSEIRAIVRDYLVRNPDVLREALDALQDRADAERRRKIESDRRDFSLGPTDAKITIVEFFDYRCPYCHAAMDWLFAQQRGHNDVRIVFKELPVLGPESLEASKAALATIEQGRYQQFHRALMGFRGDLTSMQIDTLARQAGVDVARMRRRMDDPAITTLLEENHALAQDSGIQGTPGFMINGEFVYGFNQQALDERMRQVRREARR